MVDRQFVPGDSLPEYAILQLVKDLGVAGYLKETACNRNSSLYIPSTDGWKEGLLMSDQNFCAVGTKM